MTLPGLRPKPGAHNPGQTRRHLVDVTGTHETQDQMWTLLAHEGGDNTACHAASAPTAARQPTGVAP